MALQTSIGQFEWGTQGARASGDAVNGEGMCRVKDTAFEGRFVFWGADATDRQDKTVTGTGHQGSVVAGFAERWLARPKFDPTTEASLSVSKGELIHAQTTGAFFALTESADTKAGMKVYARISDGAILAAAAGGASPAGSVATGFYVETVEPVSMNASGEVPAGSLVKISSYIEGGAK